MQCSQQHLKNYCPDIMILKVDLENALEFVSIFILTLDSFVRILSGERLLLQALQCVVQCHIGFINDILFVERVNLILFSL